MFLILKVAIVVAEVDGLGLAFGTSPAGACNTRLSRRARFRSLGGPTSVQPPAALGPDKKRPASAVWRRRPCNPLRPNT